MAELALLDKAFSNIITRLVETGQAPHYTELTAELGLTLEEGRQTLHDLIATGIPAWLHTDTDYLVSFSPFNVLPNQYQITVRGEQKLFANEGSNRWRSAGCFRVKPLVSIVPAWTATKASAFRCGMGGSSQPNLLL